MSSRCLLLRVADIIIIIDFQGRSEKGNVKNSENSIETHGAPPAGQLKWLRFVESTQEMEHVWMIGCVGSME